MTRDKGASPAHACARGWIALATAPILALTLLPDLWTGSGAAFFEAIVPVTRADWADAALNVALFIPFGIALTTRGMPIHGAALAGALLSAAIEAYQLAVPGRDPSARDVIVNTLGALVGGSLVQSRLATPIRTSMLASERCAGRLAQPRPVVADRLAFAWALWVSLLVTMPGFLMFPRPPIAPYVIPSPVMDASAGPLRIGSDGSRDGYFSGLIDEVRIHARARDAAAIAGDMQTPTALSASPDLVAAYSFDAGGGTILRDDSGRGHDGEIHNASWNTRGRFGTAMSFDGRSSEVVIAPVGGVNLRDGMTLQAWVFPTTPAPPEATLLSHAHTYFLRASTEEQQFRPAGGSRFGGRYEDARPADPLRVGAWTHLAVSYDGQTIRLFVNGEMKARRVRWSPHQVTHASLGGVTLTPGPVSDSAGVRRSLTGETDLRLAIRCGVPDSFPAPVFLIASASSEALTILAARTDILISAPTNAGRYRLRPPPFRVPNALTGCAPGADVHLTFAGRIPALRATVDARPVKGVAPSRASGWTFLYHSELLPLWATTAASLLWIGLLALPLGFWAQPRPLTVLGAGVLGAALLSPSPHRYVRSLETAEWAAVAVAFLLAAGYRYRRAGKSVRLAGATVDSTRLARASRQPVARD